MARLYQDFSFDVAEVANRPLLRLCGLVDHDDSDNAPIVVFAQLNQPLQWHRFFLDAGAAFWEIWTAPEIADEQNGDGIRLVNYFADVLPSPIRRAYAFEPSPQKASRIALLLENQYSIELASKNDMMDELTYISIQKKISHEK